MMYPSEQEIFQTGNTALPFLFRRGKAMFGSINLEGIHQISTVDVKNKGPGISHNEPSIKISY